MNCSRSAAHTVLPGAVCRPEGTDGTGPLELAEQGADVGNICSLVLVGLEGAVDTAAGIGFPVLAVLAVLAALADEVPVAAGIEVLGAGVEVERQAEETMHSDYLVGRFLVEVGNRLPSGGEVAVASPEVSVRLVLAAAADTAAAAAAAVAAAAVAVAVAAAAAAAAADDQPYGYSP